jgi:carboxypeptidase family protein
VSAYPIPVRLFSLMMVLCLFGTRALAQAQPANRSQVTDPGGYKIAGTVVSKADGHPLGRARIFIRQARDQQKFQSVVTSDDGKFAFNGLPAGKYSLEGTKRGYIAAAYDQHDQFSTAIVTGAGFDTVTLLLRLAPAAVITGKILDEAGDPVRRAMVMVYYDDHSGGVDKIHQFRGAHTDDQGVYEITPLMPGTYFLSATASPWYAVHPNADLANAGRVGKSESSKPIDRSLDVAYPVTYYADVTDADSAMPIPVRGGDRIQVDIHLTPVPALHLFFHVPGDGRNGFTFPQLEQPAFEGSMPVQSSGSRMVSPGLVEVMGIPAGRYNIRMGAASASLQMNGVDLSKDGEEVDTSSGEALSSIKVSLHAPGETTLPPRLTVGLRSGTRMLAWQPVDPKGEVVSQQVAAGRYEVLVWGAEKPYSIAHIAAEGTEVSGHSLTVPAGASLSVSLTLLGGSAEVQGTVKRSGKVFAGAMVVLVPKNPELNRDLFRRDQSDLDGTFSLQGVIPGSYTVLAIENGWDLDWSQPGVIAAYLKHGRTIEVGNQAGRAIDLREAIDVQSK